MDEKISPAEIAELRGNFPQIALIFFADRAENYFPQNAQISDEKIQASSNFHLLQPTTYNLQPITYN